MLSPTTKLAPPFNEKPVADDGYHSQMWEAYHQDLVDHIAKFEAHIRDGVTDGSDAGAGQVGEYISASAATSSVGLAFNTPTDVTSISLTAGDWEVSGLVHFTSSGGNMAVVAGWVNDASAAEPSQPAAGGYASLRHTVNGFYSTGTALALSPRRFSLASPTTVYLGALATFASGVVAAGGFVGARRMR